MENQDRLPVLKPGHNYATVTDKISSAVLTSRTPRNWWIGFGLAFLMVMVFLAAITQLIFVGVGAWGINIPVAWGLAIINMIWWAGIAHAGTLISALLLILRQDWRVSISRMTEAMTLFAAGNAALFPLLHLGRPWVFYYIFPYPNTMGLWPQFRSPLVWDVFAVLAHTVLPFFFFYMALIPDLASLRDKAQTRTRHRLFTLLALGWRGSARHWYNYQSAYFLIAALVIPLVVSLHSIISLTLAASIVPGWHITLFPPYFVAGAVFSGFAMITTIAIFLRAFYKLEDFITLHHLDNMAKVMLGAGLLIAYSYLMEHFMAWYSGNEYELSVFVDRFTGMYGPALWVFIGFCLFTPQFLWFRRVRLNIPLLFVISILANIGMWLHRFLVVVTSLHHDFLPSAWRVYAPRAGDWALFAGTIGLFIALLFLFIRFLPVISIFEMKELVAEKKGDDD